MTPPLTEEWYKQALEEDGINLTATTEAISVKRARDGRYYGGYPIGTPFSAIFTAVTRGNELYEQGIADGRKHAFAELRELIGAASPED